MLTVDLVFLKVGVTDTGIDALGSWSGNVFWKYWVGDNINLLYMSNANSSKLQIHPNLKEPLIRLVVYIITHGMILSSSGSVKYTQQQLLVHKL